MLGRTEMLTLTGSACHDNYAVAVANRLNVAGEAFDDFTLHRIWEEATPLERRRFETIKPKLITVDEFEWMLGLPRRFNTALTRRLRAEDVNFLSLARCLFYDALDLAGSGVLDEAYLNARASVDKLDFVINKRKRNAEGRDYHNIPEYPKIWSDLRSLLEDMSRALLIIERAHQAVEK